MHAELSIIQFALEQRGIYRGGFAEYQEYSKVPLAFSQHFCSRSRAMPLPNYKWQPPLSTILQDRKGCEESNRIVGLVRLKEAKDHGLWNFALLSKRLLRSSSLLNMQM